MINLKAVISVAAVFSIFAMPLGTAQAGESRPGASSLSGSPFDPDLNGIMECTAKCAVEESSEDAVFACTKKCYSKI